MVVAACFPGMMLGVRNSPLCLDVCASQCSMLVAVCRQYMDGFLAAVCCFNVRVCLLTLSMVLLHVLHSLLASKAMWSGNLCVCPVWSCLPGHYTMHPAKCRQTKGREARLCDTPNPRQLMPHQQLLLQQNVGRQLHISKTPDMLICFLRPVRRQRGACSNIQHQQQHQALHTDPGWIARQCSQIDHTHAHSTEYYTSYTTTTNIHIDTPCSLQ